MLNVKRILAGLLMVAVAALGLVVWRHWPQQPAELIDRLPENVDLALEDLHYTHNEDGRPVWAVEADQAAYQRELGKAELEAVTLTLFQSDMFGDASLTAERGLFDQQNNRLDIEGNVVLTASRGDRVTTEEFHYDAAARTLQTDKDFHYTAS